MRGSLLAEVNEGLGHEDDSSDEEEDDDADILGATQQSGQSPGEKHDVSALVNLEVLKQLKRARKSGAGPGTSDGSDSDDLKGGLPGTKSRRFKGVARLRRRFRKRPKRLSIEYIRYVRDQLGITNPQQFWQVKDFSIRMVTA